MYKSLLRKIEFLAPLWKVSPVHFLAPTYSPAHMRLSACLLGVFSPNTEQQRCTVCPMVPPQIHSLWWRRAGRGSLGQSLAMAAEEGAAGGDEWRACQTGGWTPLSHGKRQEDCQDSTPADAHADSPQWHYEWRLCVHHRREIRWICCSTLGRKFESWVESPPLTEERELAGEWKKRERERERERLFRAWFLSFIVCLLRFEYALSQQMRKMPQTLALLASSLFFSICN